ncbi:MAG: hypothetical protein K2Y32_17175 [Candidatus Obscuribacterales bacterium]|nr:hypothetical protein [Candidatus Obscuribacterales bacterium]
MPNMKGLRKMHNIDAETRSLIDSLKIASPCPMLWENMLQTGDEAVRFCGECKKDVYDVSKMSAERTSLLLQRNCITGGSSCMQLYRRADGTIITDDCPVGLRRVRDLWRRVKSFAAASLAFGLAALPGLVGAQNASGQSKSNEKVLSNPEKLMGEPTVLRGKPMMGGAVRPVDWNEVAMRDAGVKKIADQIEAINKSKGGALSREEKLKVARLRIRMAEQAQKAKVPYFAVSELARLQTDAACIGDNALMSDIIKARIAANEALHLDVASLQKELDALNAKKGEK